MKSSKKRQVVIAGAGLIGSTMALALASQGFDVTVFDATTEEDRIKRNKGRTYALSRASKNLLSNLCLLYTSPSPRDRQKSRMPSSA